MEMDSRDDVNAENFGLGCALEMFSEVKEVLAIIENVKNIYDGSISDLESQYDKLYTILKQYYEQPHLLDPHLEKILDKFITLVRAPTSPDRLKHATFTYMYQVIRVRGYKVVVRHLPHEIADLQPVLSFLEAQDPEDRDTWRSRFVLLLWLSIIVMMPFHMARLDSFVSGEMDADGVVRKTVMLRIFEVCKTYSLVTDSCAEVGAFLASKFLTRSDVKELYLGKFFEWSCQQNVDLKTEDNIKYGVLATVAAILKHGKREDLLPYADGLLQWVTGQGYGENRASLTRKYAIKIIQRIGLTYLRSRVAAWRYTRGSRSIAVNLQAGGVGGQGDAGQGEGAAGADSDGDSEDNDDGDDIPEQIEEVIQQLLQGLRDPDNIVRWSAAKGLGRVGARLGRAASADVALCLMELFGPREGDAAWHGGCLALAELARRGLLLPSELGHAVEVVLRALQYEELHGSTATGQHVRDAACYVSWAFARAYEPTVLLPYVGQLAAGLIITAVFDREINCRRAASAAFQENVGRQGSFPNGIAILTLADFFSVGLRSSAFLSVAPRVAAYEAYTLPLIQHLVASKVDHWDIAIRELSAKALFKLTDKAPEYMAVTVLPKLVEKFSSIDLNARHGSILAVGEVTHALSALVLPGGEPAGSAVSQEVHAAMRGLVPLLSSKHQFRGLGGELMRQACCLLVEKLALSKVNYPHEGVVDEWLCLVEECLSHEALVVRERAISALPAVFQEFLQCPSSQGQRRELLTKYCKNLENLGPSGMQIRMGNALAIGSLPSFALEESLPLIITSLIECSRLTEPTLKWAESRRDALKGLTRVCRTIGIVKIRDILADNPDCCLSHVFDCLIGCLNEYTVDLRGDVGAWVREASLAGLLSLCQQAAEEDPGILTAELVQRVMVGTAQLAVEKIDRTRAYAGKVFTSLLYNTPGIPNIPHHEALLTIFPPPCESSPSPPSSSPVLWLFAAHTMPLFVQLLAWPVYRYHTLLGLTVSMGDMTENLVKHTTAALFGFLTSLQDVQQMADICACITRVFANNQGLNRITIPMLNFLDRLLSSGSISPILEDPSSKFASEILQHVKIEIKGCRNVYKLLDSINVLCQLLQVGGNVSRSALAKLSICICYADKYVRKSTATRLYDALLIYGEMTGITDENLDQVMAILEETNWEQDVAALKPIRNKLCDLIGIDQPISIKRNIPGK